ncbi:hypothetical protein NC652_025237 [Populus alba x Populus x berolinensis]|nr:hypothetical protein NC652_025237 [Populus alba x Populus x berolinensis]
MISDQASFPPTQKSRATRKKTLVKIKKARAYMNKRMLIKGSGLAWKLQPKGHDLVQRPIKEVDLLVLQWCVSTLC